MEFIGKGRAARRTYGFDEIALVPASATVDPSDVDLSWRVAERTFALPIVASAMDSVVDVPFAIALSRLGGMAVLNLEGIQTRYPDPGDVLDRLAAAPPERVVGLMQEVYREPIKDDLVARRIQEIRGGGGAAVVSSTPAQAGRLGPLAAEAGAAVLLVQSTVITEQHRSDRGQALSLRELTAQTEMPVMAGNCGSYEAARQLLEAGVDALFVGVGAGAACSRRAAARDPHSGRHHRHPPRYSARSGPGRRRLPESGRGAPHGDGDVRRADAASDAAGGDHHRAVGLDGGQDPPDGAARGAGAMSPLAAPRLGRGR